MRAWKEEAGLFLIANGQKIVCQSVTSYFHLISRMMLSPCRELINRAPSSEFVSSSIPS